MTAILAVVREHGQSSLALRIFFSILLAIVFFSGLYIYRIRKRLLDRDPHVTADHYGARNLRLWQVILVWVREILVVVQMLADVNPNEQRHFDYSRLTDHNNCQLGHDQERHVASYQPKTEKKTRISPTD